MDGKRKYSRNYMRARRTMRKTVDMHLRESISEMSSDDNQDNEIVQTHNATEQLKESSESDIQFSDESSNEAVNLDVPAVEHGNLDDWVAIDELNEATLCDSSSDGDDDDGNVMLSSHLIEWVNLYKIKHNAMDALLGILRRSHPELPKSARALLKTKRNVNSMKKSNMDYYFIGLESGIIDVLKRLPEDVVNSMDDIQFALNIDGLPLFKRTKVALWPILCAILNFERPLVFPVALTCGTSKPADLDFIDDTVNEIIRLLRQGIQLNGRIIRIVLKFIVCDLPAKVFVCNVSSYTGYFGCDKCEQRGEWHGRLTYQDVENLNLRTDFSFRSKTQPVHHRGETPFTNVLEIDMIGMFPIDYMHQICLGVMKRLLLTWMYGKLEVRISAQNIITISDRLLHLKPSIRTDIFQRKPRSLLEVKFWKATELRQFLLYTGPVVLKDILRDDVFRHFLCLSVGIRILATPASSQEQIDYAEQLLIYFVKEARNIYGPEMLVYNIHSLVHICNDVRMHGHLDGYSGFAFENYMQQLKSMVRSARFPLSQIVKRLSEDKNSIPYTYKELKFKKSDCFIDNNKCYEIIGSLSGESNTITCKTYIGLDSLFKNPCDSRLVQIYRINRHRSFLKDVHISKLSKRVVMFPIDNTAAALMTLIHGSS